MLNRLLLFPGNTFGCFSPLLASFGLLFRLLFPGVEESVMK